MTTAMTTTTDVRPAPRDESAEILIIGSGFAGLGMGAQLRRRGREDFLILDRAQQVGGTWRDNTYPGAACDVPSHLYSFSFAPNPQWSGFYTPGPEIQDYLVRFSEDEGLTPHLRLGADMLEAHWDPETERWTVQTRAGPTRDAGSSWAPGTSPTPACRTSRVSTPSRARSSIPPAGTTRWT